jgi:hypothetical protein
MASRGSSSESIQKLDIDIFDAQGQSCVQLRGLSARVLDAGVFLPTSIPSTSIKPASTSSIETVLYRPQWTAQTLSAASNETNPAFTARHVMVIGLDSVQSTLASSLPEVQWQQLPLSPDALDGGYTQIAKALFESLKVVLSTPLTARVAYQVIVPSTLTGWQGLSALLKSAQQEQPKLWTQVIAVEPVCAPQLIIERLNDNLATQSTTAIRYSQAERQILDWTVSAQWPLANQAALTAIKSN